MGLVENIHQEKGYYPFPDEYFQQALPTMEYVILYAFNNFLDTFIICINLKTCSFKSIYLYVHVKAKYIYMNTCSP
jgi:hypothetical protein